MNSPSKTPSAKSPLPLDQNRRQGNRHQLHIPATVLVTQPLEGEKPQPTNVTITEMSIGGVGIRSNLPLRLNSTYLLSSFDTLVPPGMRVKIISQQPTSHGEFKIGAQTI